MTAAPPQDMQQTEQMQQQSADCKYKGGFDGYQLKGNAAGVTSFGWPSRRRAASIAIPQLKETLGQRVQSPPVAVFTSILEKEEAAAADLADEDFYKLPEHDEPEIYVDMAMVNGETKAPTMYYIGEDLDIPSDTYTFMGNNHEGEGQEEKEVGTPLEESGSQPTISAGGEIAPAEVRSEETEKEPAPAEGRSRHREDAEKPSSHQSKEVRNPLANSGSPPTSCASGKAQFSAPAKPRWASDTDGESDNYASDADELADEVDLLQERVDKFLRQEALLEVREGEGEAQDIPLEVDWNEGEGEAQDIPLQVDWDKLCVDLRNIDFSSILATTGCEITLEITDSGITLHDVAQEEGDRDAAFNLARDMIYDTCEVHGPRSWARAWGHCEYGEGPAALGGTPKGKGEGTKGKKDKGKGKKGNIDKQHKGKGKKGKSDEAEGLHLQGGGYYHHKGKGKKGRGKKGKGGKYPP